MHPDDQISIEVVYTCAPISTSGGRYHSVTTCHGIRRLSDSTNVCTLRCHTMARIYQDSYQICGFCYKLACSKDISYPTKGCYRIAYYLLE